MTRSKQRRVDVFYGTDTGRAQQQGQQRVPFYSRGTSWLSILALLIILGVGVYVGYLYQEAKKKGGGIKDVIKIDPDEGLVTDEYGRFTTRGKVIIAFLTVTVIVVIYLVSYPEKREQLIKWLMSLKERGGGGDDGKKKKKKKENETGDGPKDPTAGELYKFYGNKLNTVTELQRNRKVYLLKSKSGKVGWMLKDDFENNVDVRLLPHEEFLKL